MWHDVVCNSPLLLDKYTTTKGARSGLVNLTVLLALAGTCCYSALVGALYNFSFKIHTLRTCVPLCEIHVA